jgi:hypothetical protein
MSGAPSDRPDAAALLDRTVRLGLARYIAGLDPAEPPLRLLLVEGEAAARQAGLQRLDWPGQRAALARDWTCAEGPLARLAATWRLSESDRFLLGLAAACERRGGAALGVMSLQAPFPGGRPSVHLALDLLRVLFDAADDDALALATGPLVGSGLLALEGEDALPQRVLTLRMPLWRALAGGPPAWPGGRALTDATGPPDASLARAAEAIAGGDAGGVVLRGPPGSGRAARAATLARHLRLSPIEVPAAVAREDRGFATACRFAHWVPVVRLHPEAGDAATVGDLGGAPVVVLAGRHGAVHGDRLIEIDVAPPDRDARAALWRAALGATRHDLEPETLAGAALHAPAIAAVARGARLRAEVEHRPMRAADIAEARLALAPDGLSRLAHPVMRHVDDAALVTTPALQADLAAMIGRCRRREAVWEGLGPALATSVSRGVRALFAGDSGTGKTMAAAYVATTLAAPLFRCDLAAVMNKYIGESEKNLGLLLDHAEAADVVLLFDEADALFGRRSDGGETGERYANMLTNYLLTRLEAHQGIAILTTNAKARIDPAFLRRLDHVIDFPLPGYAERLALWRSHLGGRAPADDVLERLAAYCDLPGGGVHNAVLGAAAMAQGDSPLGMEALRPALQREYAKLRRTLPPALLQALRGAA